MNFDLDKNTKMKSALNADIRLTIIVPLLVDDLKLTLILRLLKAACPEPHNVVVIYPEGLLYSSSAHTSESSESARIEFCCVAGNTGITQMIEKGVAISKTPFIFIYAADEVGPMVAIPNVISLLDSGYDFVSCTRYRYGGKRLGGSIIATWLSRGLNLFLGLLTSYEISDFTTGLKGFRRKSFEAFNLESGPAGWAVALEISLKSILMQYRIAEIPIVSVDRLYGGKSRFNLIEWVFEYGKWTIWAIKNSKCLRKNKREVAVYIPDYLGQKNQ